MIGMAAREAERQRDADRLTRPFDRYPTNVSPDFRKCSLETLQKYAAMYNLDTRVNCTPNELAREVAKHFANELDVEEAIILPNFVDYILDYNGGNSLTKHKQESKRQTRNARKRTTRTGDSSDALQTMAAVAVATGRRNVPSPTVQQALADGTSTGGGVGNGGNIKGSNKRGAAALQKETAEAARFTQKKKQIRKDKERLGDRSLLGLLDMGIKVDKANGVVGSGTPSSIQDGVSLGGHARKAKKAKLSKTTKAAGKKTKSSNKDRKAKPKTKSKLKTKALSVQQAATSSASVSGGSRSGRRTPDASASVASGSAADADVEMDEDEEEEYAVKMEEVDATRVDADEEEETYCTCNRGDIGEMIFCEGKSCPIGWYHVECVDMEGKNSGDIGDYFCADCEVLMAKNAKATSAAGGAKANKKTKASRRALASSNKAKAKAASKPGRVASSKTKANKLANATTVEHIDVDDECDAYMDDEAKDSFASSSIAYAAVVAPSSKAKSGSGDIGGSRRTPSYVEMISTVLSGFKNGTGSYAEICKSMEQQFSKHLNRKVSDTSKLPVWKSSVRKMLCHPDKYYKVTENDQEYGLVAKGTSRKRR